MTATGGRFVPADEDLDLPEPLGERPEVSVPMDPTTRRRNAIAELRATHIPISPGRPGDYCRQCDVKCPCHVIQTLDKWRV